MLLESQPSYGRVVYLFFIDLHRVSAPTPPAVKCQQRPFDPLAAKNLKDLSTHKSILLPSTELIELENLGGLIP